MICEECKKQFKSDTVKLRLFGYCRDCGEKLRYRHVLDGYWYGVLGSALPVYILVLSPNNKVLFLSIIIGGLIVIFGILSLFVNYLGKKTYRSKAEFEKHFFVKKSVGTVIGFISIFLWFYLVLQY